MCKSLGQPPGSATPTRRAIPKRDPDGDVVTYTGEPSARLSPLEEPTDWIGDGCVKCDPKHAK